MVLAIFSIMKAKKGFFAKSSFDKNAENALEKAAEEHIFIGNPPFANIDCRIFRKVPNYL